MKQPDPPKLTDETKQRIDNLAAEIEEGARTGKMDKPEIVSKITEMTSDALEHYADSYIPDDIADRKKYRTPRSGNAIDTALARDE